MIYADYNGSAPPLPEVRDYLIKRLQEGPFANPNAIHRLGKELNHGIEKCRKVIATKLGAKPKHLFFNSGASEGISQVFSHALRKNKRPVLISGIEHSAVVQAAQAAQALGHELIIAPTLPSGLVDLNFVKSTLIEKKPALVAIMAANNETGVIQPFEEIGALCAQNDIPYLCDTTQFIGKAPFNFSELNIDFAVTSGHKIGALTGVGILLVKNPLNMSSFVFGGGQERGMRGGTQNYLGIETMAVACECFKVDQLDEWRKARDLFEKNIQAEFPQALVLGQQAPRLPCTTLIALPGVHGQAVQIELESEDIYCTTSSACSDNQPETSKVLKAMGVEDKIGRSVVRLSPGGGDPKEIYQELEEKLLKAYRKLGQLNSF